MNDPAGNPSWTRTATPEFYGGHQNKRNYLSLGSIDARTDVNAEQIKRLTADLAAVVRTAPFAVIDYVCNDTAPAAPTILRCRLQTGVVFESYPGDNPPQGFPSAARLSDGKVRFTFPVSPVDDYGATIALNLTAGMGNLQMGVEGDVSVVPVDPNVDTNNESADVAARDDAGAIADAVVSVELW